MKISTVHLDLDGVLGDFDGASLSLFDVPSSLSDFITSWDGHGEVISTFLGRKVTQRDFKEEIQCQGFKFWANLPVLPWAKDLFSICSEGGRTVVIMTKPMSPASSLSASGKIHWISKNFPGTKFAITDCKSDFARPDTFLIDDNRDWCDEYKKAGGKAYCFPRPWSDPSWRLENPLKRIRDLLYYG